MQEESGDHSVIAGVSNSVYITLGWKPSLGRFRLVSEHGIYIYMRLHLQQGLLTADKTPSFLSQHVPVSISFNPNEIDPTLSRDVFRGN
jgi:methyl coenzyme M reductase subunit C-like uncharacterized protein (methanogenesis marker protein 7)